MEILHDFGWFLADQNETDPNGSGSETLIKKKMILLPLTLFSRYILLQPWYFFPLFTNWCSSQTDMKPPPLSSKRNFIHPWFQEFELQYMASTIVVPLVRNSLSDWVPLAGRNESIPHLTTFTQWKDILDDEAHQPMVQPGLLFTFFIQRKKLVSRMYFDIFLLTVFFC